MLIWLVGGFILREGPFTWRGAAPNILLFILLLLVGWKAFGAPLHD